MGAHRLTPAEKAKAADAQYGIPHRPPAPEGWSPAAWRRYLDDPDGGRAACRRMFHRPPDTAPCAAEILSQEA